MKNVASNGISLDSNKYKNKAYPILTGFRLVTSILSGACCMLYSFAAWTSNWFFSICASFSSKPGGALLVMIFWKRIGKIQFCILITKMILFYKKFIFKNKIIECLLDWNSLVIFPSTFSFPHHGWRQSALSHHPMISSHPQSNICSFLVAFLHL